MAAIVIENIISYAQIADKLDIQEIVKKIPEFNYNPDEFSGVTLKLNYPKTAVLLLPNGKAICTGAKNFEDVEDSIKEIVIKLKGAGIKTRSKTNIETYNIVASFDLSKELHLSSISSALISENVNYAPEQFPGLIYKMDNLGVILLIFSSGKIVCTGAKSTEDASKAIDAMKDKLSSLGVL